MAGVELVEWYQIHQTHGFHVFDAIPSTPFQLLLWAVLPSAASTASKAAHIEGSSPKTWNSSIWRPIPYIVHSFWPGPIVVVHYIGNKVAFGTQSTLPASVFSLTKVCLPLCSLRSLKPRPLWSVIVGACSVVAVPGFGACSIWDLGSLDRCSLRCSPVNHQLPQCILKIWNSPGGQGPWVKTSLLKQGVLTLADSFEPS